MNKIEVLPNYKTYDGSTKPVVSYEGVSASAVVILERVLALMGWP